jgi:sucrose-6-phosphate hydrolase SacC (GH32 family)
MNSVSSSLRAFATGLLIIAGTEAYGADRYTEPYRPQFHFTPEQNWMNDPNGMLYFEGEYHLFYQYNPFGNKWGHMSWGHAVSPDLVHWEHLPLAIPEKDGIMIFSGSAVVDAKNTSGFGKDGKPPLVAIYTGHREKRQDQRIAFSNDRGRTWTQYEGNPVLDLKMADFRDPKVSWHEPTQRWVMVVALSTERKVHFYSSPDLKKWEFAGEFGPAGSTVGIWECPDLFPLEVEGERGVTKWALIVNVNPGGPAGGTACQYFVGSFDGKTFVVEPGPKARPEKVPEGKVIADFEANDYAGWKVEGDAFGSAPAPGTLPRQQPVSGFRGKGLVNSYCDGDRPQGTLTSPPFEITAGYINFLIGGGAYAGETCVNLLIDGKVVRTATGQESERLQWHAWDVRELRGKRAEFQIVDRHTGRWGHINVDHLVLADEPAQSAVEEVLWADFGPDFFAAVSWFGAPDGRRLWLAWMSNWQYANDVPTTPWRSAMTVPRAITLRRTPDGLRMIQRPVPELEKLRKGDPLRFAGGTLDDARKWLSSHESLPPLLDVELALSGLSDAGPVTLNIHSRKDELTSLTINPKQSRLSVDRRKSGQVDFHQAFPGRHEAPLRITDGRLRLRLLLDTSSLEVFAQDGEMSYTGLIFPSAGSRQISVEGEPGAALRVDEFTIHALKSAW